MAELKGGEVMAVIYATLIIKGKKTFAQVAEDSQREGQRNFD